MFRHFISLNNLESLCVHIKELLPFGISIPYGVQCDQLSSNLEF